MTFDGETPPRIQFATNPLKVVVLELRFPVSFRLSDPAVLAVIQDELRQQYPIAVIPTPQITMSFGPEGSSAPLPGVASAQFRDDAQDWTLTIKPGSVSIETTAYAAWPEFRHRAESLLALVGKRVAPTRLDRVGLRYINEIDLPVETLNEASKYIDPALVGIGGTDLFGSRVTKGLEQLSVALNDGGMTFRHGWTAGPPGDGRSSYVIDTDIYQDRPSPFDPERCLDRLDEFHGWNWSIFRGSITNELVELLGEQQ